MVIAEGENGCDETHEVAEEDIKAVVAEIPPPRGGNEDGDTERGNGDEEEV